MNRHIVGRMLMMLNSGRMLQWNILIQCPAKSRIDKLDASAYSKDRLVKLYRSLEYQGLHFVSLYVAGNNITQRFFMIERWRNIMPSSKQKSIAYINELIEFVFIR